MFRVILLIVIFSHNTFGRTDNLVNSNKNPKHYHEYLLKKEGLSSKIDQAETTAEYWKTQAKETINERLKRTINTNTAKNVILFLGDGMSVTTVTAARTLLGQRQNTGEGTQLSFENFPFTGLSKTYCVDSQVADSACSSTAYLSGAKANYGTLGVTAAVQYKDCAAMNNQTNHVYSIVHLSQQSGKRTGIVTTTKLTDASPAGTYSHTGNREWQSDSDVVADGSDPKECIDLAQQLIHGSTGPNINVILGGGNGDFIPKTEEDENGNTGLRSDGRNLINEWKEKHISSSQYVYNVEGLNSIPNNTEYVLGFFAHDHVDYNLERNPKETPSLEQMTVKAIDLLSQGDSGFFLFVEGGRIDHGHHGTLAQMALDETVEFHKAIQAAIEKTNESETLIVVTADHSHTMTFNGYPTRGSDILGIGGIGTDDLPYTSLSYANGPGDKTGPNGGRPDITNDDFSDPNYVYPSFVPVRSETHGGDDVSIYARGPWSHLFVGVAEQSVIPYIIQYASCVGNDIEHCVKN